MVAKLDAPRVAWVMVPAGATRPTPPSTPSRLLARGDVVIDGGNSNYKDAAPRRAALAEKGIGFVDAGTSGGVWGLANGYCLMVGGTSRSVKLVRAAFLALAPEGGYAHVGPVGAGHFVKMVHNGIEYGLMQAYAEGFEIMAKADEFSPRPPRDRLDLALRLGGAVLAPRAHRAGARARAGFEDIEGIVVDSGEGRWTAHRGHRPRRAGSRSSPPSLFARFASRDEDSFSNRLVAALRNQFGGHAVVAEAAAAPGGERRHVVGLQRTAGSRAAPGVAATIDTRGA